MPLCPKCRVTCGMWENGLICPGCMTLYSFLDAKFLPEYNAEQIYDAIVLYEQLGSMGLLGPGVNRIEFIDDGIMIDRLGDVF